MADTTGSKTGLIFIPDISGFTRFVQDVEIDHSSHIIRELLEKIIDSNTLGLEISEIEGDAVLFYRMGAAPGAQEIFSQVQRMYEEFHTHLKRYEWTRICHCGACSTAHDLELKFVVHFGRLSTNTVKDFTKLFGTDLIVAHRLLKNHIELDEYLLVTKSTLDVLEGWTDAARDLWAEVQTGTEEYDLGAVDYLYVPLSPLKSLIPEPVLESYAPHDNTRELFRNVAEMDAPLDMVFNVMSDVSFRHHWQSGLKDSTDLNGAIPHEGSTHRCVIDGTSRDPFQISHDFKAYGDTVTWVDTDTVNNVHSVIKLEKIASGRTRVTIVFFAGFGRLKIFAAKLFIVRKLRSLNEESLAKLNGYLQYLLKEGKRHSSQVVLRLESP